jgi:hypothetical protein
MSVTNPIDKATAKKALSSYIKGLIQDFNTETGERVELLNVIYTIEDNRRIVKDVQVITTMELPQFNV